MWLSSSQITIIMFLFPGVAKVQVVADENTDPMSLQLSKCSVDHTVLGQFPVFFNLHRADLDTPAGIAV